MKLKHIAIIGSLFPILFSLVLFFGDVYKRQATFHPAYRTTLTMKPTGEIWIWAVASLKQAEVCARYHINAGKMCIRDRQNLVAEWEQS